jgi:Domain of unknown function (DUF4277)
MAQTDRRQPVDHLGLVAGRWDARGLGAVLDHAPPPHPARRELPVGAAVNAMVRKGLGWLTPPRARVPRGCPPQPTSRLMAPRVLPAQRPDAALGRAWDTREASGVTARDRRMAATAATRLGGAPPVVPLARPRVDGDGRDPRGEAPAAAVRPSPGGDRRAPRPDRPHVRREGMGEHPAGLPVLRPPRRGQRRAGPAWGPVITASMAP